MPNQESILQAQNVRFRYDPEQPTYAVDGVSVDIRRGEFVAVLGANGCGKSTLAKHFNAILLPEAGTVLVEGMDTRNEDHLYDVRQKVGMVFQNPDDQLVASLIENDVAFGPENLGVPTDDLRQRVADALADVGLQGFDKRETAALSGGQKQRVAIAGVLAMEPSILILDEATAMLDPRGRKGLMRVCHELHDRGMTVVMITHFMEEAAQADRVIVLEEGRVACDGTPQDVLVQAELLEHLNLDLPFAAELSLELGRRGVPVGMHIETTTLKEELCRLLSKA